jgi:glycerophosphoryl diester phosphodiesterase
VGADAWELDVQLTRDGAPVVIHDESLLRTTNVARVYRGDGRDDRGWLVADFDLAEIRALEAGSWFVDPRGGPRTAREFRSIDALTDEDRSYYASGTVRVPTLAEALDLTLELHWRVNVELKSFRGSPVGLAAAVLGLIHERHMGDRVLISSFDHGDVAWVARETPDVATGVLALTPLFRPERYVREIVGAASYHPAVQAVRTDFDALRSAGVPVLVFTVNDHAPDGLADRLRTAGVSGIFTDAPGPLVARWRLAGIE